MADQPFSVGHRQVTFIDTDRNDRAEQHRLVDALLIPWLDYHLKGRCNASALFQNILTSAEGWTFNQSCEPCFPVTTAVAQQIPIFRVFPVPSKGNFYIEADIEQDEIGVRIFNEQGMPAFQQTIKNEKKGLWEIDAGLIPGVYYAQVSHDGLVETLKLIVQQ